MKYNDNYVKELLDKYKLEIVTDYEKVRNSFYVKNEDGYLLKTTLKDLDKNSYPNIAHPNNIYSIENIKLWCKLNNKTFTIVSDTYINNTSNLVWHCNICNEDFPATFANIKSNKGCPFCTGRKVSLSNCLATTNPEIAEEWDYEKNGNLTPYDVTSGSKKKVWWRCKTNSNHSWQATIAKRKTRGCPYCSGYLPDEVHNFGTMYPELLSEWDYSKNTISQFKYTVASGKKVWWICAECGHSWKTSIAKRTCNKTNCPKCNKSKGEIIIHNYLESIHKYFIPQKEFENLLGVGGNNLSYDFYLPNENLLIEYQGQFHDGTAEIQTNEGYIKQQEHDRRKKQYSIDNNIKLLEIWYWDLENIEIILQNNLN